MSTLVPTCPGTLTQTAGGSLQCSQQWEFTEYSLSFDPSVIDIGTLAAMWSGGFVVMLTFWGLGFGLRAIFDTIKKAR